MFLESLLSGIRRFWRAQRVDHRITTSANLGVRCRRGRGSKWGFPLSPLRHHLLVFAEVLGNHRRSLRSPLPKYAKIRRKTHPFNASATQVAKNDTNGFLTALKLFEGELAYHIPCQLSGYAYFYEACQISKNNCIDIGNCVTIFMCSEFFV